MPNVCLLAGDSMHRSVKSNDILLFALSVEDDVAIFRTDKEFVLLAIVISEHTVKTYRSISLVYRKVAGICFNSLV